MASQIVWEDKWGEVIDRPDSDYIEIRWYDTTHSLDGATFNDWPARFASLVERAQGSHILTDSTVFLMPMDRMDSALRDANFIPRYNRAGVKKFAFLMPEGMPAIGAPPVMEGMAAFPSAYFADRESATAWLAEK